MRLFLRHAVFAVSLIALSGCQTTQTPKPIGALGSVLSQEAREEGYNKPYTAADLERIEANYKSNPKDVTAAVQYARVLREFDYINRAAIILRPFAQETQSPAAAKAEYSAIQLALGNYIEAEQYAQNALLQDAESYDAYHYLGIALDAQGQHEEAERAFRKGLDHWQGDPTPIMNNLALNLAAQGYFSESIALLEKAITLSPERVELTRNLRIVNTLKEGAPEKKRSEAATAAPKPIAIN